MKLLIEWDKGSLILEPEYSYILGRDSSSDIFIDLPRVSRSHLRFSFSGKSWILEDLGSSNGTYDGKYAIKKILISKNMKLNLGGIDNYEVRVTLLDNYTKSNIFDFDDTKENALKIDKRDTREDDFSRIRLRKRIKIGRDINNDWVIDDPNVSRYHAEIIQNTGGNFELIDLKSMNGTFLNDQLIKREALKTGDVVRIGNIEKRFTFDGLETIAGIEGTEIVVENLSFQIKDKTLLDKVSFKLGPRTLTAIIGPSGAGKSTLLGVLNGRAKPTKGKVLIGGVDLHENYPAVSGRIGSVPQSDILHTNLTVRDALSFSAALRFPDDTSADERIAQVDTVLERLELKERANLRIDKLSGGQRKRASIGLELLTSPEVLLLDEPTSGLDPGLDAHVMETLRDIADSGQTVVVVTHSVDNLDICDNVILMASGGHLAYCGPASSVFAQLGKKTWAEVFRLLASDEAINLASHKFTNSLQAETSFQKPLSKNKNFLRQTFILSKRYMKVIASDKFYLSLLALIPIIIGCIAYFAGSKYGFGPGYQSELGVSINPYARGSILVLILGSIFVGLSTGIQEIVKEKQIRIREQAVGIKPLSYLLSKIFVLGAIVVLQMIVFVQIVLMGRPLPKTGIMSTSSRFEIISICSTLAISSMLFGLLISSLITSTEQAMPSLVGMTMVQVVLSGSMPLSSSGALDWLSKFSPSFWATNALSGAINLVQISRITDHVLQHKWESSASNLKSCLVILCLFMILFSIGAWARIKRVKS